MNYWFLTMFSHARANCIGACHNSSHSNCISMTIQQLHNIILFKIPTTDMIPTGNKLTALGPRKASTAFS